MNYNIGDRIKIVKSKKGHNIGRTGRIISIDEYDPKWNVLIEFDDIHKQQWFHHRTIKKLSPNYKMIVRALQ